MKGLTLKQPWAWAIAHAGKDIENRDWDQRTAELMGLHELVGQVIAIHGGAAPVRGKNQGWRYLTSSIADIHARLGGELPDAAALNLAQRAGGEKLHAQHFITPGIVAVACIAGVTRASRSVWASEGTLHIQLSETIALPEPVQCPGAQGFWRVPEAIEREVQRQYRSVIDARPPQHSHLTASEWL
jgi:hypothetical protein